MRSSLMRKMFVLLWPVLLCTLVLFSACDTSQRNASDADIVDKDTVPISDDDLMIDGDEVALEEDILLTDDIFDGDFATDDAEIDMVPDDSPVTRITKQWGTEENDFGQGVAVDSAGNIYITGVTFGSMDDNSISQEDCNQYVSGTQLCSDVFLTKRDPAVKKLWTKQWGTIDEEQGRAVAVDSKGNIYVTGFTRGSLDGNTNAGGQCRNDQGYQVVCADVFLTKWNADGTKGWTRQWGVWGEDVGNAIAVDAYDDIFVVGNAADYMDGNVAPGGYDIFLTKWHADGTKEWTKQWGTEEGDAGMSVTVDSSGAVYAGGGTRGGLDGNPPADGFCDIYIPCMDAFLTKWDTDGTKLWTKQWGTTDQEYSQALATGLNGAVLVVGTTGGALDGNEHLGSLDVFMTEWNNEGTKEWTRQWGTLSWEEITSSWDTGTSIAVGKSNDIYVTGYTSGAFEGHTNAGGICYVYDVYYQCQDIFLTKIHGDGTPAWTVQWGVNDDDMGNSVAIGTTGTIYVVGTTGGGLDGNMNWGGYDIFLSVITEN